MTNENRCILRSVCPKAGVSNVCTDICGHFIQVHGSSGTGGRIGAANIPKDYAKVTVGSSPIREEQSEVYRAIDAYVRTFSRQFDPQGERIKALYLYSEATGTGKTTTACAILNEYILRHYVGTLRRGIRPLDRPAYFLSLNRLQSLYNKFNRKFVDETTGQESSKRYYGAVEIAQQVPLLVIDDIGVRSATEPFGADVHDIIDHRVSNRMPTIYTSNVPIEELSEVYDRIGRLQDRVNDMCLTLEFKGESKRGMRRDLT